MRTGFVLIGVVLAGVLIAAGLVQATPPAERKGASDTLIHNVLLVDGTGGSARAGAVRIRDDRIVEVGALEPREGETSFDGGGNVLAPGFIDSHSHHDEGMRNENVDVFDAIREAVEVGRRSGAPVQISHIKLGAMSTWGQTDRVIALLEEARESSIEVSADIYPYTYWQTTMGILFPDKNYDDPEGIRWAFDELLPPGNVLLSTYAPERRLEGMTIAEIASRRQEDPAEVYVDLMHDAIAWSEAHEARGESIIGTSMAEEDVAALMAWRGTNICSDGASSGGHPRGYGSFPRVLGRYVRQQGVLSLEEAVHKMTGLTASHLGIENRGTISPGMYADLVLFDPATVEDRARIGDSTALSNGILNVWVNGRSIFADGSSTGAYAGRFLTPRSGRCTP